jgi:hypothetical protein
MHANERLRSSGRLSRVVSQETRAQARPSARGAMKWSALSEERPQAFVEQSPVVVSIEQLDEISFADRCREMLAMSSEAALDEVVRLQQAKVGWGRKGLGTARRPGR